MLKHAILVFCAVFIFSCKSETKKTSTSHWISGDSIFVDGPAVIIPISGKDVSLDPKLSEQKKNGKMAINYLRGSYAKDSMFVDFVNQQVVVYKPTVDAPNAYYYFEKDSAVAVILNKKGVFVPIYNLKDKIALVSGLEGTTIKNEAQNQDSGYKDMKELKRKMLEEQQNASETPMNDGESVLNPMKK